MWLCAALGVMGSGLGHIPLALHHLIISPSPDCQIISVTAGCQLLARSDGATGVHHSTLPVVRYRPRCTGVLQDSFSSGFLLLPEKRGWAGQ